MHIAIVGRGHMGSALGTFAMRAGHQVMFGSRDREQLVSKVLPLADLVILAIPYAAVLERVVYQGRDFTLQRHSRLRADLYPDYLFYPVYRHF